MLPLSAIRRSCARLGELFRRQRIDADFEDELDFHLQMEIEQNARRGMSRAEAERAARVAFGGVERVRQETRAARGVDWLEGALRDARFALRRLRRDPRFAIPAIVTLALGIGAVAAVGTFVVTVLLRPLPYPNANRIVALRHAAPGLGDADGGQSGGTYALYRDHARTLDAIGAYQESDAVSITEGEAPQRVRVAMVTPSILTMLGARTVAGRLFAASDLGAPDQATTVILSASLWRALYAADPRIVGRQISLNRHSFTVVGVLDSTFDFPSPRTQIWYAVALDPSRAEIKHLDWHSIARMKPGLSTDDVRTDLARLIMTLPNAFPDVSQSQLESARLRPVVEPLRADLVRDVQPMLLLLAGTSLLVLVIAWSNAANLFLIRAERAEHEVAVARAMGAGVADIARRFVVEGLVLGFAGATVGFGLAVVSIVSRFGFDRTAVPRMHELHVDIVTCGIAATLAVIAGVTLGAVSLLRGRRGDLAGMGRSMTRVTSTRGWQLAQRIIVGVQVALALTLLIGATLMARSLSRMRHVDQGFDSRAALTFQLALPYQGYEEYQFSVTLYERILENLRRVPGVRSAEVTEMLPLDGAQDGPSYAVEALGGALPGNRSVGGSVNFVTPGYFGSMRIALRAGRAFQRGDIATGIPPVILSRAFADKLFGSANAVGRQVRFSRYARFPSYTVVGVAENVLGATIASGASRMLYFPLLPELGRDTTIAIRTPFKPGMPSLVVRADALPTSLLAEIRRIVHDADPQLPVTRVQTLAAIVDAASARARLLALLLLVSAGSAVMLGVVGVYGVASYAASQRQREIGIRVALGATPRQVRGMLLRQDVTTTLAGIAGGVVIALALGRLLRGLLYQTSPTDPIALWGTAAVLFAIALCGSWLPARRAARADPMRALRSG